MDSGSSTSFITERFAQTLRLKRSTRNIRVVGIAGISTGPPLQSVATFSISPVHSPQDKLTVSAIVVPRVTCDLPVQQIPFSSDWNHLSDLQLADPEFGQPGRIDLLLGIDVYTDVVLQGRRSGPAGTPAAFESLFGWVLARRIDPDTVPTEFPSHHVSTSFDDDILRKLWEIEEGPGSHSNLTPQERTIVQHFEKHHARKEDGRFTVPLPRNPNSRPISESREQAVRRFLSLEKSLHARCQFDDFARVMEEYMELEHAEVVPIADLHKPCDQVFYLPMHAVHKEHSTTTKIRAVFDASAKSTTGVSLNDTLLVGPTVHPPLIDVLLRFRSHKIALIADVSKMYRAVELKQSDRDLHRFVWRSKPTDTLTDYRMTRVTFGVSASSFAANMAVKQNAIDYATEYPQAAQVVYDSFYVDDCLTGADSVEEAIRLHCQLSSLFDKGGFLLRKWNSSNYTVLESIPESLRDAQTQHVLPTEEEYTKTLGVEWNSKKDHFRLTVSDPPPLETLTKRGLASDVAKTFDILGWFAPATITVKILLQRLWEEKLGWDDPVPRHIKDVWSKWRSELPDLSQKHIPRCYFESAGSASSIQLHGFSDASESAYSAVVYLRTTDQQGHSHVSLIMSKTKVAPIKRLSIPRLELCGAHLLAQLLHHVKQVLQVPISSIYAWSDSTIVLNWLDGGPKRFKTYVGNRISTILDLMPPDRWGHVRSTENPADCASRGLYPSELLCHTLWWDGPHWLKLPESLCPKQDPITQAGHTEEEKECIHLVIEQFTPIISFDRFSTFAHLKRVSCWVIRFVSNCREKIPQYRLTSPLTTLELQLAESYWHKVSQSMHFQTEIKALKSNLPLPKTSNLIPLSPIHDSRGLLRVGGRRQLSQDSYVSKHPIILHSQHKLTHMIVHTEHIRLLHAGPTLLSGSLSRRFHIVGGRKLIRSITRACITCRKLAVRPQP